MEILPRSMRTALALALHEQLLSTIPIFYQCGSEFIAEVALALVPERYNAGERVATYGQLADRLYVIFQGACVMSALGGRHITTLTVGDFFGEANLLKRETHRTTVICYDFSELWILDKARLDAIRLQFPTVDRYLHSLVFSTDPSDGKETTVPAAGAASVGSGLLRSLSVQYDEQGVRVPVARMVDHSDDPIVILRWSFCITRLLRRVYAQDCTVRIFNRINAFGSKVYDDTGENRSQGSTPRLGASPVEERHIFWPSTEHQESPQRHSISLSSPSTVFQRTLQAEESAAGDGALRCGSH